MMCVLPAMMDVSKVNASTIRHAESELIVSCADPQCGPTSEYMTALEEAAAEGKTVVHFAGQFDSNPIRDEWNSETLPWYDGRGNISFMTNDETIAKTVKEWTDGQSRYEPPKCVQDLEDEATVRVLLDQINEVKTSCDARHAFPAEMEAEEAEEREPEFFDSIEDDEDIGNDTEELLVQEREMLEEMPLPGRSKDETF